MFLNRQFFVFLISGGVAAAVNFGSRILLGLYLSFSVSIVIAYVLGMVTAYILNRVFVFSDSGRSTGSSVFYFTLVNLLAVLQTWLISMLLAFWLLPKMGVEQYVLEISHLVGVIVPVFTSFIGHKHLSFKAKKV